MKAQLADEKRTMDNIRRQQRKEKHEQRMRNFGATLFKMAGPAAVFFMILWFSGAFHR